MTGAVVRTIAIAGKDLRSEWRTKETINAALSFTLVILLLFSFAFDPSAEDLHAISGGLLWLVFLFAGTLILNRSFARELQNNTLDAVLASPVTGAELFLAKALANFALLLGIEAVALPIFGVLFDVRWLYQLPWLAAVFVLGTWAITVVGTVFSALTVNLRLRELMLPTLVYPAVIPALLGAIQLTTVLLSGEAIGDNQIWFRVLAAFDMVFTLLSIALAEIILLG